MSGANYRDEQRIEHMYKALVSIQTEAKELTRRQLDLDDMATRALMYSFVILGEAANNLSDEFCAQHPEVPWADVAGFRHKLVHDYAGVDFGILWGAVRKDVPKLLPLIKKLYDALPKAPDVSSDVSRLDED